MKKLLFGVVTAVIAASPALAHRNEPSWRSPASSDLPPVFGLTFGAYPYGPMPIFGTSPYGRFQGEKADTLPPTKRDVHKR